MSNMIRDLRETRVGIIMAEDGKRREWEARQAIKASEDYQLDMEFRQISQIADTAQSSAEYKLSKVVHATKDELYDLIISSLKMDIYEKQPNSSYFSQVEDSKIDEVMRSCASVLKVLKTTSDYEFIKNKQNSPYTLYERLFNELIKSDPRFIKYADYASLNRKSTTDKISKMSNERKEKFEEYYNSVMENPDNSFINKVEIVALNNEIAIKAEKVIDKLNCTKDITAKELQEIAKEMGDNIYEFLMGKTKLRRFNHGDDVMIKMCNHLISSFKKLSSIEEEARIMGVSQSETELVKTFDKIIELDVRFASIAPKKNLAKWELDLSNVSGFFKEKIFNRYANVGLLNYSIAGKPENVDNQSV